MRVSRLPFLERRLVCAFAVFAAVLFLTNLAEAEVFCVQTADDFQDALDEAESNNQDDTILLVRGTYTAPSSPDGFFFYLSSEPYGLTIEGDWEFSFGDCARLWSPSPIHTTIDGEDSHRGLLLQVRADEPVEVTVKYLTFKDGKHSDIGHIAGGLTVYAGLRPVAVTVEANRFFGNSTEGYGGGLNVYTHGRLQVINNLFAFNQSTDSFGFGAAVLSGSAPGLLDAGIEIYNNTVALNFHDDTGDSGMYIGGDAPVCFIDNNIFWLNGGTDIHVNNSSCTLLTNDIEDLAGTPTWNQGAMSVYPDWVDPVTYGFQLLSTSPLVNQGLVRISNYSMPTYDLDGLPRFSWDSPVDIGAYEVQYLFYDDFENGTTNAWSVVIP